MTETNADTLPTTTTPISAFDKALGECFSHLRDVSARDGNQSWDGNRWTIDQICDVIADLDQLSERVKETGHTIPPVEAWGGGCVLQNARFLGENPLYNLARIRAAGKHLVLQDLDRGNQLYGMVPASTEAQMAVRTEATRVGIGSKRIFDMMNDRTNLKTAIDQMLEIRAKQEREGIPAEKQVKIEGAISYISAGKDGKRAVSFEEYGKLAVFFAKSGCDSIVVKDYAGQLTTKEESLALAHAINAELKKAKEAGEIDTIPPLNWHSHSNKPEILKALLDSGEVTIVDTAIGDLSKGTSHTNVRELLTLMMKDKGFDLNAPEHQESPILKQLSKTEQTIATIAAIHKPYRVPLDMVSEQEILDSKLAGGAVSALWGFINKNWNNIGRMAKNLPGTEQEKKVTVLKQTLSLLPQWWDAAGQFNTVTPGSTIAYDQALAQELAQLQGKPLHILNHVQSYKDVVKGRWGVNLGLEAGNGDQDLRKAYQIMDCIKILQDAAKNDHVVGKIYHNFMQEIGIPDSTFNLNNPDLETQLRNTDINTVKNAFTFFAKHLPEPVKAAMEFELSTQPYPAPTVGLEDAKNTIQTLAAKDHVALPDQALDHWAINFLMCREKGMSEWEIGEKLFTQMLVNKGKAPDPTFEAERFDDIEALLKGSKAINRAIEVRAKAKILEAEAALLEPMSDANIPHQARLEQKRNSAKAGINALKPELNADLPGTIQTFLQEKGYGSKQQPPSVYGPLRMARFMETRLPNFLKDAEEKRIAALRTDPNWQKQTAAR